jgi:hypothetical protein
MIKSDLRERGYYSVEKIPKQSGITVMWILLALFIMVSTFVSAFMIIGSVTVEGRGRSLLAFLDANIMPLIAALILAIFVYLALKLIVTLLFCTDKTHSVKLKFLEIKSMPICFCREAFKVWQTVVIYLAPASIIYSLVFVMCLLAEAGPGIMLILFFISFFLAFDLTLVVYVLYLKVKEKAEYIAIDHHVYGITLFSKPYIRENRNATKNLQKFESKT